MRRILFLILLFFLLLFLPVFIWFMSPEKPLEVSILDKTVPDMTYREHKGLIWLLNNQKYVKNDYQSYIVDQDYYGFFPQKDKKYTIKRLDEKIINSDMIYVADTYGVYEKEFYGTNKDGDFSKIIYGGLKESEVDLISRSLKNNKKLVVEFNSFADPTRRRAKRKIYKILGLEWTGWIGRYFKELEKDKPETEVPIWAIRNYEKQHRGEWGFKGEGFLFANENGKIVVARNDVDIAKEGFQLTLNPAGEKFFGFEKTIPYSFWFDIIVTKSESEILAEYQFKLTENGIRKLKKNGIPDEFPAIVRYQKRDDYISYYFAGDYVDVNQKNNFYKASGLATFMSVFQASNENDQNSFYWRFYVPMMKRILYKTYENKQSK